MFKGILPIKYPKYVSVLTLYVTFIVFLHENYIWFSCEIWEAAYYYHSCGLGFNILLTNNGYNESQAFGYIHVYIFSTSNVLVVNSQWVTKNVIPINIYDLQYVEKVIQCSHWPRTNIYFSSYFMTGNIK